MTRSWPHVQNSRHVGQPRLCPARALGGAVRLKKESFIKAWDAYETIPKGCSGEATKWARRQAFARKPCSGKYAAIFTTSLPEVSNQQEEEGQKKKPLHLVLCWEAITRPHRRRWGKDSTLSPVQNTGLDIPSLRLTLFGKFK